MESSPLREGINTVSYTEAKTPDLEDESAFICNICLDITNKDPVVTQCGHLYCWPCLYRWLNTHQTTCPVCKAGVTQENVIPLYIRGSKHDPRTTTLPDEIPNRPAGRRPEPQFGQPQHAFGGNNQGGGAQMGGMTFSVGFGFFPSLFGLQFQNYTEPSRQAPNRQRTAEELQQESLSRALIMLGSVVLMALLFF